MIKIGILPTYNKNERPFLNSFSFINNYPDKLLTTKSIPLGILFPNGIFNENILKEFDGFLIPGGKKIHVYHILTIHYAYTNNKPLLGICLGMQAIGIYSSIINILKTENMKTSYQNIIKIYKKYNENYYLKKINNHNQEKTFYQDSIKPSSHKIYLLKNTKLYNIYKTKTITEPSIHEYTLKKITGEFIINAKSKEGYIEGIEHSKNFIIGVQFHPELEEKNKPLFESFINACK